MFSRSAVALAASLVVKFATNVSGARQVVLPELSADGKITYGPDPPNPRAVTLTGDFLPSNTRLAQDEASGLWSFTPAACNCGTVGAAISAT